MKVVRVAIIQKEGGCFVVEPPVAFLETGDTFRVINTTDTAFQLQPGLNHPLETPSVDVAPNSTTNLIPHHGPVSPARQSYALVTSGGIRAQGNSDPVIIIDDPL